MLIERVRMTGGTAAFAQIHNLSQTYVQMVMRSNRTIGPKILDALGLQKVVRYERVPE